MDTSDPGIEFDAEGVSNHARDFEKLVRPNWHPDAFGRQRLQAMVQAIKSEGRGKEFDCILGLSGGLDSSYLLHLMVAEFGLRPLVFHVDGGWNSEVAVHNIRVLVEKLGLDLYTEVINWEEMKNFQLAMFKAGVPHLDIPQDHAFVAVLYKFAEKHGVNYVLNGGNISTESVMTPLRYFYWGTDLRHIRDILARFGTVPMDTYPFSSVYRHKIYLRFIKGLRVEKPLNYVPFSNAAAIRTLQSEYGWKPYPQKHFESRFTRFYEGYWLPTRFGFDVRRVQLSSLILTGQITRADALLQLEQLPYDPATVKHDISYVATKLGISVDELQSYHSMPTRFYWDYKNQHAMLSKAEKISTLLGFGRRGSAY
jgi:N-acetyl sugar amidotransferase